jgi:hypothetical protein
MHYGAQTPLVLSAANHAESPNPIGLSMFVIVLCPRIIIRFFFAILLKD